MCHPVRNKVVWSPVPSPRACGLSLGAALGCPQAVPRLSSSCSRAVPRVFLRGTHGVPTMPLRCLIAVPESYTSCPQDVPKLYPGDPQGVPKISPGCPAAPKLSPGCPHGATGLRMGAPSRPHLSSGLKVPPALTLCLCRSDGANSNDLNPLFMISPLIRAAMERKSRALDGSPGAAACKQTIMAVRAPFPLWVLPPVTSLGQKMAAATIPIHTASLEQTEPYFFLCLSSPVRCSRAPPALHSVYFGCQTDIAFGRRNPCERGAAGGDLWQCHMNRVPAVPLHPHPPLCPTAEPVPSLPAHAIQARLCQSSFPSTAFCPCPVPLPGRILQPLPTCLGGLQRAMRGPTVSVGFLQCSDKPGALLQVGQPCEAAPRESHASSPGEDMCSLLSPR